MNPKKLLKGILRGTFLILVFTFIFINCVVYAEDNDGFSDPVGEYDEGSGCASLKPEELCKETDRKPDSPTVIKRYGIQIINLGGDKFKLTMSKNCAEKVYFKVLTINKDTGHSAVGKELKCDSPVEIDMNGVPADETNDFGIDGVTVVLRSNCNVVNSPKEKNSCKWNYVQAELFATRVAEADIETIHYTEPEIGEIQTTNSIIDCKNKTYQSGTTTGSFKRGDGSFYDKFCLSKKMAIDGQNGNKSYGEVPGGKYTGDPITFKCDYRIDNIPTNPDTLVGEGYWTNSNYIYGTRKHKETATLYYHYAPNPEKNKADGGHVGSKEISCEVTCEEAVEVQYGPPVASSAGMCFEYKVRATSRVSCNMTDFPPDTDLCSGNVCTPVPDCWHSGGNILTQAGPNDEFNACVQRCDGGKYTKKCSTSCYNQVYGSVSAYAKTNSVYFDELFASDIYQKGQRGSSYTCEGYYASNGSENSNNKEGRTVKEMYWNGMNNEWNGGAWTAGRYYCKGWQNRDLSYREWFYADENGFFRKLFSSGLCGAECIWTQCLGDVYLNTYIPCNKVPGGTESKFCSGNKLNIVEFDCDQNKKKYEALVRACLDKSTCSTTTAEFTIDVDYTKKDGQAVKVKLPYNGQKDSITNSSTVVTTTQENANTTLIPNFPGEHEGIYGCYMMGGNKDRYRVTWGTPSTWMNLKTGEISFEPKSGDKLVDKGGAWFEVKDKFCLPGDTKPVNVRWANAYLRAKIVNFGLWDQLSPSNPAIEDLCKFGSTDGSIATIDPGSITESDITYNILAKAVNFGLLEWDFNIKCFYGIANPDNPDPDIPTLPDCSGEEYRVRSTDLENLFPSTDGSQKAAGEAGRMPGFNWSEYAVNTKKNEDYKSDPVAYMKKLQEEARNAKANGTEIYTSDNLDYEFVLMPDTIREMRKSAAGNMGGANYTSFKDSDFSITSGVGRYRSSKIRGLAGSNKIPDIPAINCNNMKNYGSNECDPVHNG